MAEVMHDKTSKPRKKEALSSAFTWVNIRTCLPTEKSVSVTDINIWSFFHLGVPRKVSCEHRTMTLYCRRGLILNILSATYGRSDRTTCRHPSMGSTQCAAASSLSTVRQQCQNKRYCRVTASNRVFGDPCRGTFKYLTVTYNCVGKYILWSP